MEKLLKTRTDKRQFLKWIEVLRSGKYSQTKGSLQDSTGYCCLGIACKVLIPINKQEIFNDRLKGGMPDSQFNAPQWLKLIDTDYSGKSSSGRTLANLNDKDNNTFKQIATKVFRVYKKELDSIK